MRAVPRLLAVPVAQRDLAWLRQSLQAAIELEFATIPPYLYALWSIKDRRGEVADAILGIAWQEMFHLGMVCNLLTAVGGVPRIRDVAPVYPGPLPGGVRPELKEVYLAGLAPQAGQDGDVLRVFMNIEAPERPLARETYPSIGAFYTAVQTAFRELYPKGGFTAGTQVAAMVGGDQLSAVTSVATADRAFDLITEQGEGTTESPQGGPYPRELAHYYRFGELWHGKALRRNTTTNTWEFSGDPIARPAVHPLGRVPAGGWADAAPEVRRRLDEFNTEYQTMLGSLETVWAATRPTDLRIATQQMYRLSDLAAQLVQVPAAVVYGPEFTGRRG